MDISGQTLFRTNPTTEALNTNPTNGRIARILIDLAFSRQHSAFLYPTIYEQRSTKHEFPIRVNWFIRVIGVPKLFTLDKEVSLLQNMNYTSTDKGRYHCSIFSHCYYLLPKLHYNIHPSASCQLKSSPPPLRGYKSLS